MSNGRGRDREIELKLQIPDPSLEKMIVEFLGSTGYGVEPKDAVHNEDLYLDTFDGSLRKRRYSLRLRRTGRTARYTLKSTEQPEEGLANREELEVKVSGEVRDPARIPDRKLRRRVEKMIYPRRLIEQLEIRTHRRLYTLKGGDGSRIELSFDTYSFLARGLNRRRSSRKRYELEAELKKGSEIALVRISDLLRQRFGLMPAEGSKYESALKTLRISFPTKTPPPSLRIRLDDRFDAAVNKILAFQMQRFEAFLPGTRLDIDSEFVHQARVATRRMRSALRLFRGALPEATAKHLERELRWLGQVFGEVRDLDVFLLNLPGFVKAIETKPRKQVNILKRWIDDHRDPFLEDLIEALDSKRLDSFRKRLANFLERPLPKRPRAPLALRPVQEVAPEIIGAKYDSVISRGRKTFSKPKLKNFHSLRIQTKKLRYACEFMAPAYGPALTGFIKKTVRIQDCLGELQDTVFTRAFIEVIVDDWKNKIVDPDMLFMLGEIYQLQGEIAQRRIDSFAGIWEEFDVDSVSGELKGILNGGRKEGKADKAPETAVDDGPPRLK